MNSNQEESLKQSNEPTVESKSEINGSPPNKKFHGDATNEHAKPKRRGRRGKKRKQRKESGGAPCLGEQQEECRADHPTECEKHALSWDSEEEDVETEDCHAFSDVMIRPINVPKAPENSTQFIIDDHDECRLYMSFETPNPYLADYLRGEEDDSEIVEPDGEDAAYVDIDYEYESPHDFDNSAYYDREFELSYKNNRYDELLRLPRNDLISGLQNLENRLRELNDDLVKEDPDPILERLQSELLELQEKHFLLKEENLSLTSYLEDSGVVGHLSATEESEAAAHLGLMQESVHSEETSETEHVEGNYDAEPLPEETRAETDLYEYSTEKGNLPDPTESLTEQVSKEFTISTPNLDNSSSMDCMDACVKETVLEEHFQVHEFTPHNQPCHVDSCSEHIPVKEKVIMRDSEYHESQRCEEMPLNAVPEEHELNAVAV